MQQCFTNIRSIADQDLMLDIVEPVDARNGRGVRQDSFLLEAVVIAV
jgi:hypothetical protein